VGRGFMRFRHGANVTKAKALVNGREKAVESAELNSLYRPGAYAKISYLRNVLLRETRSVLCDGRRIGTIGLPRARVL
jgi:hypothetical protein